jgi:hypothetical protein
LLKKLILKKKNSAKIAPSLSQIKKTNFDILQSFLNYLKALTTYKTAEIAELEQKKLSKIYLHLSKSK